MQNHDENMPKHTNKSCAPPPPGPVVGCGVRAFLAWVCGVSFPSSLSPFLSALLALPSRCTSLYINSARVGVHSSGGLFLVQLLHTLVHILLVCLFFVHGSHLLRSPAVLIDSLGFRFFLFPLVQICFELLTTQLQGMVYRSP